MDTTFSIASHGPKDTSDWRQNGIATLLQSSNECQKQCCRLLQSAKQLVDFAFRLTAAQGTPRQKWRHRERMLQIVMIFSDWRHVWQISYSSWRRRRKRHAKTASQGKEHHAKTTSQGRERHTKNWCIWSESEASNGFPTN